MTLTVITGQAERRRYRFSEGRVSIGRDASNDVVCNDPSISRVHAEMWLEEGTWHIRDCGSTNGMQVNGLSVDSAELRQGDKISMGRVAFTYSTDGLQRSSVIFPVLMGVAALAGVIILVLLGRGGVKGKLIRPAQETALSYPGADSQGRNPGSRGEELLRLGAQRLKDWRIARGNAFLAQKAFEQALPLLRGNPQGENKAMEGIGEARRIVDEEFRARRFSAEQAIRTGEKRRAEDELKAILESIPEPEDARAQYARERLRNIERGRGGRQ